MKSNQPPKWIDHLLDRIMGADFLEGIQGDLLELYRNRIGERGTISSSIIYFFQALGFMRFHRLRKKKQKLSKFNHRYIMWNNYSKVAIRNLQRHKGFSAINILGLSIGFATFILISLYIQDELSYDQFHPGHEKTFRVVSDLKTPDNLFNFVYTPAGLVPLMEDDFSEIATTIRLSSFNGLYIFEDKRYQENQVYLADKDFFKVFGFKLLKGNIETVLDEPYQLVISESIAQKYFGDNDPIGKTMTISGREAVFEVSGLMEDVPQNSHLHFDILASFSTQKALFPNFTPGWFNLNYFSYVRLYDPLDVSKIESGFPEFIERRIGEAQERANQYYTLFLQPVADIHLNSDRVGETNTPGNVQNLYIFSTTALLVLLIACINFVNLSTARSISRAKEVGMRKAIGATRIQLNIQFLMESIFLTLFAFIISLLFVYLLLPFFNNLAGKTLFMTTILENQNPIWLIGLVFLVGLISGIYPAVVLSGFSPVNVLKTSTVASSSGFGFRNALVVIQLVITTLLISGTIIIGNQLSYLTNIQLGFDKDQMMVIDFRFDRGISSRFQVIKDEFSKIAGVKDVAASIHVPSVDPPNMYARYESENGEMQNTSLHQYLIDFDFLDVYDIELMAGRKFTPGIASDSNQAFMINYAASKFLGWEDPEEAIGKKFFQTGKTGEIIGVVNDFNFMSLHQEVIPLAIQYYDNFMSRFSIKIEGSDLSNTISTIEEKWKTLAPDRPLEYSFVDQDLNLKYVGEARTQTIFTYFASLAIIIACLGLFGMSSYMASQMRKDMSIRKVMGASFNQIVAQFGKRFSILAVIAVIISMPLAYFGLDKWLQSFPYRVEVSIPLLVISGILVFVITWFTISYESIKTALVNPAENLRD